MTPPSGEPPTALTTGDVAELIGVHASTVKRWFASVRSSAAAAGRRMSATTGGHRRIPLQLALRVARERGREVYLHGFGLDASRVWHAGRALEAGAPDSAQRLLIDWLNAGRTRLIGRFLRHATGMDGSGAGARPGDRAAAAMDGSPSLDPRILDGLFGGFMQRVGTAWRRGRLPIRLERAASREVSGAIHGLLDRARREEERAAAARARGRTHAPADPRPTAVVATVEREQHLFGSLLVQLVLVQRGWRVEHLGTGLPVAEIIAAQQAAAASLVCVSFTPPRGPADVRRFVDVAGRLANPCQPFALVLGGGGARGADLSGCDWPFGSPAVLNTLAGLDQWLDGNPGPASHA